MIRNFQYYTPEQFFQYLAGVHGRDEAERQALLNRWIIREKCWTYQCGEVVVVFQEEQGAEGEKIRLEFYPLENGHSGENGRSGHCCMSAADFTTGRR